MATLNLYNRLTADINIITNTDVDNWLLEDNLNKIDVDIVVLNEKSFEIGDYAFDGFISLNDVWYSGNITKIGNFAFQNASFARVVRIPKFVKEIGFRAFYALSDLEEIKFYDAIYYGSEAYKTELKYVGGECFMNCYKLRGFTADKVDSIAEHAFSGCLN